MSCRPAPAMCPWLSRLVASRRGVSGGGGTALFAHQLARACPVAGRHSFAFFYLICFRCGRRRSRGEGGAPGGGARRADERRCVLAGVPVGRASWCCAGG